MTKTQCKGKGEQRGAFLVVEESPSWSGEKAPTYIHCNSRSDFITGEIVTNHSKDVTSSSAISTDSTNSNTWCTNKSKMIKIPIKQSSFLSNDTNSTTSSSSTNNNFDESALPRETQPLLSSTNPDDYARQVNKSLNLHLGLPFNPRNIKLLRVACNILSFILFFVEDYLFQMWDRLPLSFRQSVEYCNCKLNSYWFCFSDEIRNKRL